MNNTQIYFRRYWECTVTHHAIHHLCEDADDGTPMMFDLVYDGCNYDFLTQCGSRPKCDECNDNCENNPTTQPDCGHEMDCSNKVDIHIYQGSISAYGHHCHYTRDEITF